MSNNHFFPSPFHFGKQYTRIIGDQIGQDYDTLDVVSGFVSGSFIEELLAETAGQHLRIRVLIGMAGTYGIPVTDHEILKRLCIQYPSRLSCFYYTGTPGIHAKGYTWSVDRTPSITFIGSPNLSKNGMKRLQELSVLTIPINVLSGAFGRISRDHIARVVDSDVASRITIYKPTYANRDRTAFSHDVSIKYSQSGSLSFLKLSLLTGLGTIPTRSGINWGQRTVRDPDEAYIAFPASVRRTRRDFFPKRGERFTVLTDTEDVMVCVIAQQNDKAIESTDDNSLLGKYLRKRIGVSSGVFVTMSDFVSFGSTEVVFTRIDDETYLLSM